MQTPRAHGNPEQEARRSFESHTCGGDQGRPQWLLPADGSAVNIRNFAPDGCFGSRDETGTSTNCWTDYRQRSRPDLLMIPGRSCSGKRTRHGAARGRQVACTVELKVTSDDRVQGAALKEALTQHAALASRLESRGFKVQLMPIIIGSSGMIRRKHRNTLQH